MKSSSLLCALAATCAAHYLPAELSKTLIPRGDNGGQNVGNPDKEPGFQVTTSGDTQDKSRVLTGVGPDAANQRYFDWDETCTDAEQRQEILDAWTNFQPLVTQASEQLKELSAALPQATGTSPKIANKRKIAAVDQAFTQYFSARDNQIDFVKGAYDVLTGNVQKGATQRGDGKPGALRFICDKERKIKQRDGKPFCSEADAAAKIEAAEARTQTPRTNPPTDQNADIELAYHFETATSITFCPPFFDKPRIGDIVKAGSGTDDANWKLDKIDCRERIIMHEYFHVPWVRDMAPGDGFDQIGYLAAAQAAQKYSWLISKQVPDCYAWYTLYGHFNNIAKGCGDDVWPKGVKKPTIIK